MGGEGRSAAALVTEAACAKAHAGMRGVDAETGLVSCSVDAGGGMFGLAYGLPFAPADAQLFGETQVPIPPSALSCFWVDTPVDEAIFSELSRAWGEVASAVRRDAAFSRAASGAIWAVSLPFAPERASAELVAMHARSLAAVGCERVRIGGPAAEDAAYAALRGAAKLPAGIAPWAGVAPLRALADERFGLVRVFERGWDG